MRCVSQERQEELGRLAGSGKQKRQQRCWRYGHEACYYPALMVRNKRLFVKIEIKESAIT